MKMISVAVVEDLVDVALEFKEIINEESDLTCSQVYFNAEEALIFLPSSPPDIVLIDIGLPKMNGIEMIIELKKNLRKTQFCMFTVFEDDKKIFQSILAGARGYILKNDPPTMMINALRELHHGGSPMSPVIARKIIDALGRNKVDLSKKELPLSCREMEILKLLSKGLLYKEIAALLNITIGTVKQHIHKIYQKLHVSNRTEAINKLRGNH